MTYSTMEEYEKFLNSCLSALDKQVFALESEEAKRCAIQAVQRVLRDVLRNSGEDVALEILRCPKRIILPKID